MTKSETSSGRHHRGALRLEVRVRRHVNDISESITTYIFGRGGSHRFSSVKKVWNCDSCSDIDMAAQTSHFTDVVSLVNAERRELNIWHRTILFRDDSERAFEICDSEYKWYWGRNWNAGPTVDDLKDSLDWVAEKQSHTLVPFVPGKWELLPYAPVKVGA